MLLFRPTLLAGRSKAAAFVARFVVLILLAAAPARAIDITGSVGVFTGLMPWSLGTDIDFGANASLGLRVTDHLGVVVTGQILTAHVDNHSLDNLYDWQRWLSAFGVAAQVDIDKLQLRTGGGLATLQQCLPVPLAGHPCDSDSRRGPALVGAVSYALIGPLRADLSASWFVISDQYGGNSGSIAVGVGAGF